MKKYFLLTLFLIVQFFIAGAKPATQKVELVLRWKHQFQFAGYYAALEKGYYSELGIGVEIIEGTPDASVLDMVSSGKAIFGVGNVEVLASYLRGEPLVLLASIMQHSPSVLIVKESSNIYNPHDLVDKNVMLQSDERGYELLSMLYNEGVKPWQLNIVTHTHSINEFLANEVDAISAYITSEPYFLETYGIPYRLIKPSSYGIDFYSDCLFTNRWLVKQNPELVDDFVSASLKGWEYALNNKEEMVALIVKKYSTAKTYNQLLYEANEIHKLINPELVAIGHTNQGRWFSMANFLYQQGLTEVPESMDNFFYHKEPNSNIRWDWIVIFITSFLLIALLGILFYVRVGRAVTRKTKEMSILLTKLEEQNKRIGQINTQLLSAREIAEENLRDKSTFFAGLTSELKNPVKGMVHAANELTKPDIGGAEKEQLIWEIRNLGDTLDHFSKDITSIFILDPSAERISYCKTEPNVLIKNFADKYTKQHSLGKEQIKLNLLSPLVSQKVLIDKEKVLRSLDILLSNALKHTPGVKAQIGWSNDQPEMLTFWLNDNGAGLSLEQLAQLNQFFSDPLRSFSKGAGYGLTLVKALVHLMKGTVWVTYEQSVGTTFFFRIPFIPIDTLLYLDSMKVFDKDHLQRIGYNRLRGKTILIYEAHLNNYILTRSMLEGTGCTLVQASNMEKVLSVSLGFNGISMVLVSVSVLSNIDISTIQKVRNTNVDMPIIANVTYHVDERKKYQLAGFTDVIQRPTSRGQLIYNLLEFIG